jgi:meiotic recombination protein DMC1
MSSDTTQCIVESTLINPLTLPSPARPAARGKAAKSQAVAKGKTQAQEEEVEETSKTAESASPQFIDIEKLQDQGINAADLKKLKESGIYSAFAVLYTTKKDLCNIKGLSEQKVEKIQEAAKKLLSDQQGNSSSSVFMSGLEFAKLKSKTRLYLSSGASKVDEMLGGGFESGTVTELFGEFRCGKTAICHSLAVISQLPVNMGGSNCGKVCYIDTEGTFRPDRISQISQCYNLNPNSVLSNIIVARTFTVDLLLQCLVQINAKFSEDRFSLLVIDSIMAPFRVDYSGRGELAERQQVLAKVMSKLHKMAEEWNIVIIITNQVMADPAAAMSFAANPPKPIGGHILAHFSQLRLALRKGKAEQRIMKIYDSPNLPELDCVFEICDKGIQDAKE